MAKNTRQTSSKAAKAASKVLRNPKSTKAEKTAAASALSQTPKRK
jgi:D-arabinose 5-phosphate isomerase GutQ